MNPVEIVFRTVHAQAVAGMEQLRGEMGRVRAATRETGAEQVSSSRRVRSAREQEARDSVAASVRERRALAEQLAAYRNLAATAKRGSVAQVEANRLAAQSANQLGVGLRAQEHHAAAARGEMGKLERGALAGSGAFRSLGRQVAFASGAFLGALGFISVIRRSVEEAGQLDTQLARSRLVFGEHAKDVTEWSRTVYQALGISQVAALGMANSFGTMLTAMGLAPARAAAAAKELTRVAAAISLARGESDPGRASQAINVAIAGRGRALRQYGIILDATTIKAEAMRLGLLKTSVTTASVEVAQRKLAEATAELRDAEAHHAANSVAVAKAQDRVAAAHAGLQKVVSGTSLALTKEQTAAAAVSIVHNQGRRFVKAYADMLDTAAGRARRYHQGLAELQGELGKALLPALVRGLTALNRWIASVTEGGRRHRELVRDLRQVKSGADAVYRTARLLARGLAEVVRATGGWGNAFKIVTSLFLANRFLKLVAAVKSSRTAMVLFGAQSRATAAAVEGSNGAMVASSEASAVAIKAAFATTILGAAILVAIEIVQHWKQVKAWFQQFWIELKAGALLTYKDIVEPFSHLPGALGGWARRAKVNVDQQLAQLAVDAGRLGAEAGDAWGGHFTEAMFKHHIAEKSARELELLSKAAEAAAKGQWKKVDQLIAAARAEHRRNQQDTGATGGDTTGGGDTTDTTPPPGGGDLTVDHPPPAHRRRRHRAPDYSQGAAVARAAETQLGVPYVWGGTRWNVGLDCSGLAQGALRQIGISIPRTSQEQWASANVKNPRPMLPGDLCFFEGPHPGHVAVYVGGGRVVHAPHTGARVQYASLAGLSSALGFTGSARYWHPGQKVVGGGGPQGGARAAGARQIRTEEGALQQLVGGAAAGVTIKTAEGPAHVDLPRDVRNRLHQMVKRIRELWRRAWKDGVVTKSELDQITNATNAALKYYAAAVKKTAERLKAEVAAAEAQVTAAKDAFETAWGRFTDKALGAFDRETERLMKNVRAHVAQFGFDIGMGEETPSERRLREREQARADQEMQDRVAQAQQALAEAQAGGDAQAIADAQKELNDALYDQETEALQKQADAERAAADDALAAAQQEFQDQRDLQRQALEDQLADLEKNLEDRKITWSQALTELNGILGGYGVEIGATFVASMFSQLDLVAEALRALGIANTDLERILNQGRTAGAHAAGSFWDWLSQHPGGGAPPPGAVAAADGGVAFSPTHVVAGDAGAEALLPLEDPRAARWLARVFGDGRGGPSVTVVVPGATLLGRDRDVARRIAQAAAPEIRRRIGYRNANST